MQWPITARYLGSLTALLIMVFGVAPASRAATEMQELMVPASDPGIQLYVRNKHPAGKETFSSDRILLYVHGATYPSETMFDLPVAGALMMDVLAAHGWDVWLLDVRGYGRSTRQRWTSQRRTTNPSWTPRRPCGTWARSSITS
jgi:pimeloyl-ACP methyl ester carboxylesterase